MAYHTFTLDVSEGIKEEYGSFETFFVSPMIASYNSMNSDHGDEFTIYESGWYWWSCFPGCLPDSEAYGPFDTEDDAIKDARGD